MAESFSAYLRTQATGIWKAILSHPFLAELAAGTLPEEKFRFYIAQDYHYLGAFGQAVALALGKAADGETARLLALRVLTPIERPLHSRLFELTSQTVADVEEVQIAPTNRAYMDHLLATASMFGLGETAATLLPCPWTYDEIGAHLKKMGAIKHPIYSEWAGFYEAGFLQESVRAWREHVDREAADAGERRRKAMLAAFLLSSRYELRFWNMAYRMERWEI